MGDSGKTCLRRLSFLSQGVTVLYLVTTIAARARRLQVLALKILSMEFMNTWGEF